MMRKLTFSVYYKLNLIYYLTIKIDYFGKRIHYINMRSLLSQSEITVNEQRI
jgi:hypothetical protein